VIALLASAFLPVPARAEPTKFGGRTLEVPVPAGFVPVGRAMPKYMAAAQGFLPAEKPPGRVYVPLLDAQKLRAGMPTNVGRYYQLQVVRSLEGKAVSAAEFGKTIDTMEAELAKWRRRSRRIAARLSAQGNAALDDTNATTVSLGQVRMLGVFRKKDWGLFFTNSVGVGLAQGDSRRKSRMLSASGIVRIDGQVLYLLPTPTKRTRTRAAGRGAVSTWADAVHAANPGTAAVPAAAAAATDLGAVATSTRRRRTTASLWAALALVGVVLVLLSRRRRKR
jgi:hypothetical protein